MKKLLVVLTCALALGAFATNAAATTLSYADGRYLGYYTPPEPADATSEAGYINTLLTLSGGFTSTIDGVFYSRIGSSVPGPFDAADPADSDKDESGTYSGIDVTGWTYLIAKYDGPQGGGMVWYVGGLTNVDVPASWPDPPGGRKGGLSHYSLYNSGSYLTPDGGMTLMRLGGALLGVGALRRKFRS